MVQNFDIVYSPTIELQSCYKSALTKKEHGQKLFTVDSDATGMAIQVALYPI